MAVETWLQRKVHAQLPEGFITPKKYSGTEAKTSALRKDDTISRQCAPPASPVNARGQAGAAHAILREQGCPHTLRRRVGGDAWQPGKGPEGGGGKPGIILQAIPTQHTTRKVM